MSLLLYAGVRKLGRDLPQPMPLLLREPRVAAEPGHAGPRGPRVGRIGPIGALEEMRGAKPDPSHRRRIALDVGPRKLRHQPVRALAPPAVAGDPKRLGVMGQAAL